MRQIFRKLRTFRTTVRYCKNWPAILLARYGLAKPPDVIKHRNGTTIEAPESFRNNWGQFFEPFIADVYGILVAGHLDLIVDVGANIGAFSSLAARRHAKSKIIAYEPNSAVTDKLLRNLKANAPGRATHIAHPLAATKRTVTFYDNGAGGSSSYLLEGRNAREMTTVTPDDIPWQSAQSAFVKLDCEGAEGEIIDWFIQHADKLPPIFVLACEYHPWCPVSREESEKNLLDAGFLTVSKTLFDEPYLFAFRSRNEALKTPRVDREENDSH